MYAPKEYFANAVSGDHPKARTISPWLSWLIATPTLATDIKDQSKFHKLHKQPWIHEVGDVLMSRLLTTMIMMRITSKSQPETRRGDTQ